MKAFLDTSVLVAAFYGNHERHAPTLDLLLRFQQKDACCGAHSLAEIYSVLTGRMGRDRVSGDQALLFLSDVRERLTVVGLDPAGYTEALEASAATGIAGGAIYDALLARCAVKAAAKTIYTWNPEDFERLGPEIAARVKSPNSARLSTRSSRE